MSFFVRAVVRVFVHDASELNPEKRGTRPHGFQVSEYATQALGLLPGQLR
jgi:hypothetical protein